MRTVVYIDGFNLYYGALRGTPYKWLDLHALFREQVLTPDATLERVKYYTAPVKGASSDDADSPHRQQRYLRALKVHRPGRIEVISGVIMRTTPWLRTAERAKGDRAKLIQVVQFTEKQTDVNLTADLISDAWQDRYDQVVLCSNDSDLAGALRAVRRDHERMRIGLVSPARDARQVPTSLRQLAHWHVILNDEQLAASQLPETIPGTRLTRPAAWKNGNGFSSLPEPSPTLEAQHRCNEPTAG